MLQSQGGSVTSRHTKVKHFILICIKILAFNFYSDFVLLILFCACWEWGSVLSALTFFYLTTRCHIWIHFVFILPKFYIIFILSPTPFLLRFCVAFFFI